MQVKTQVSIASLSTFQNIGHVQEVRIAHTPEGLRTFLKSGQPFCILGKGSNVLIDPKIEIPILQVAPTWCAPQKIETKLHLSAGTTVHALIKLCTEMGLAGMEFAAGVPASVGGMVAMNFGCWESEMSHIVEKVRVFWPDGTDTWLSNEEIKFGYRTSLFHHQKDAVITEVVLSLTPDALATIKQKALDFIAKRNAKQPLREKTFGSTFKNPPGQFAGALIESLGLKGQPMGDVMFSEKHANFMVNRGNGTFDEAVALIRKVQSHTPLEMEVQLIQ